VTPRASFLVLQVRPAGWRFPILLPVPLFVLEEALEAVALLARVLPWRRWAAARRLARSLPEGTLLAALDIPAAAIRSLRVQGRLTLAEVREGSTHVAVRLV